MTRYSISRPGARPVELGLGALLGRGGAKAVHELPGHPHLVAALYLDPARGTPCSTAAAPRQARIQAMLARPPKVSTTQATGARDAPQLAWPSHALHDAAGRFVGYAMPRIPAGSTCELESLLTPRGRSAAGLPESQYLRVLAARNLAALLRELHREEHWVVDLKPLNLKLYRGGGLAGTVALLDVDGFSVKGAAQRWPADLFSSEYISPEALRRSLPPARMDELHDRWALAVIAFRLLNNGLHPYSGVAREGEAGLPQTIDDRVRAGLYPYGGERSHGIKPSPVSLHRYFDAPTRDLFERAFGPAPERRPSAAEWRDHLDARLASGSRLMLRCRRDPDHWHAAAMPCGACALKAYLAGQGPEPGRGRPFQAAQPAPLPSPAPARTVQRPQRNAADSPRPTPPARTEPPLPPVLPDGPSRLGGKATAPSPAVPAFHLRQRLRDALLHARTTLLPGLARRWPTLYRCLAGARDGLTGKPCRKKTPASGV